MDYDELEKLLSQPRLNRYLKACGNSKSKAKKLYDINLRLSQSFYPILNLFEIILRNEIHYKLSAFFSNPNWIIVEKKGFMSDNALKKSQFFLKNQVIKIETKLSQKTRNKEKITSGQVIAEQSLGFWTALFLPYHYKLIKGYITRCFPNKPSSANRKTIYKKLKTINDFRNRIYHNEPICFSKSLIDFHTAETVKKDIFDLLFWINPSSKKYVELYDSIDDKIALGKKI